ncbi:hypothetical protein ACC676_38995, partial [Rhizobium ruizarguesonis]
FSAAIAMPFFIDSRYVLGQIVLALFYATIASQWNLLFGFAGVFSLAQMAIFAFGGYATAMICPSTYRLSMKKGIAMAAANSSRV